MIRWRRSLFIHGNDDEISTPLYSKNTSIPFSRHSAFSYFIVNAALLESLIEELVVLTILILQVLPTGPCQGYGPPVRSGAQRRAQGYRTAEEYPFVEQYLYVRSKGCPHTSR